MKRKPTKKPTRKFESRLTGIIRDGLSEAFNEAWSEFYDDFIREFHLTYCCGSISLFYSPGTEKVLDVPLKTLVMDWLDGDPSLEDECCDRLVADFEQIIKKIQTIKILEA